MPISDTAHDRIGIADQAQRLRADDRSADDIAERRAEPELAEQGDEDQRRAEHEGAARAAVAPAAAASALVQAPASSIAASSARNGSRIAPWRDVRDRAGASASRPQPPGSSRAAGEPAGQARQRLGDLVARPPGGVPRDQRRRGLAERAGADLLRQRRHRAAVVELDLGLHACCRRSASAARARPVDPLELAPDRAATPPAAGSRSCRAARS